jgi:hypothetical protein
MIFIRHMYDLVVPTPPTSTFHFITVMLSFRAYVVLFYYVPNQNKVELGLLLSLKTDIILKSSSFNFHNFVMLTSAFH